jgi:hypothetical protein
MEKLNLVLQYRMAGDTDSSVRGAARIEVDGRGGLTLYDAQTARAEKIDLAELRSLSIRFLACASEAPGLSPSREGKLRGILRLPAEA